MRLLITSIFLVLLYSCGTTQRDGWQLASAFHENYANEFTENSEFMKYAYNPRVHFYSNIKYEGPGFRALIHDTLELRIIVFENQDLFLQEFGIELDTFTTFSGCTIWNENGNLKLQTSDSLNLEILRYEMNPLEHFKQLKNLVNKYGIVTYHELRIGGIIEVYFSAYDYLLYFPTNYKIDEPQFEEHWRNKQKQGKQLDQNWYFYHSDEPLDFG